MPKYINIVDKNRVTWGKKESTSIMNGPLNSMQSGKSSISKEFRFREMEFLVTIAHAIAGGVESPLQLTFQVRTLGVVESMG